MDEQLAEDGLWESIFLTFHFSQNSVNPATDVAAH